jgi:malate dehydrogenase (quinone)
MLDVLERCFPARFDGWRTQLKEIVPSFGTSLAENPGLLTEMREWTDTSLGLVRP